VIDMLGQLVVFYTKKSADDLFLIAWETSLMIILTRLQLRGQKWVHNSKTPETIAIHLAHFLIGELDMLIAAHAKSTGRILVTNNTHEFERVKGLEIEDWKK